MIFLLKNLKPVLLIFSCLGLTACETSTPSRPVQTEGDIKILRNKTYLLVGMVLLFLSGCTAQQVDKILAKIPDSNGSQSIGEPTGQNGIEYSGTDQAMPKIIFFEAQPPFVVDGSSTTLRWRTDNAISAQISGIGTVKVTDTHEIAPRAQTTYTLVATNNTGQTVSNDITISLAIFKKGELPNDFKIKAIKRFNELNPKKVIKITPQSLSRIKLKSVYPTGESKPTLPFIFVKCASQVQGKIAWDYKGSKQWANTNINRLCKGAENSPEPARCFQRVMHGGINWGGGTKWKWQNAIDLCEGSQNASATIGCFQRKIGRGSSWQQAIRTCGK